MELKWTHQPKTTSQVEHWQGHLGSKSVAIIGHRRRFGFANSAEFSDVWETHFFGLKRGARNYVNDFPLTEEGLAAAKEWIVVKLVEERMS